VNASTGVVTGVSAGTATITYTVTGTGGCPDGSATRSITVNQPSATTISQTICAPNSYTFNGQVYTSTGTYTATLVNAAGCDSVITLNLTVLSVQIITQPAATLSLNAGASGSLSVVASGATTYQWQVSVGGGAWINLSNDANYSGVFTATLSITANVSMNGYQYRVLISNVGCPTLTSSVSTITVTTPVPAVVFGQVSGCPGTVVTVPITVQNFNNIGAVSLDFLYDSTALTYTGFNSSALTGNLIINNPSSGGTPLGRVLISWFSLSSSSVGNGLLMNLTFIVNRSTSLTWNVSVAGQCELADGNGDVIPNVIFTNGSVTALGAQITTQPVPSITLNTGASGSLSVVASGASAYQWQVSVSGGSWTNLSNGGGYSGVTTATLEIVAANGMNGNQYRVVVSGTSCADVVSTASTLTVTIPSTVASVTTSAVTSISSTGATSGGNVTSDGGAAVTARGVAYGTGQNPTTAGSFTSDGSGTGSFTSVLSGLTPSIDYNVRAYAVNSVGTAYGAQVSFTTSAPPIELASVTTSTVTGITSNAASTGGNVTANGGAAVTARGVAYGTTQSPTILGAFTNDGSGNGVFISLLSGLTPSTTYYVRAYATNSAGTAYGNEVSFATLAPPAVMASVTTTSISSITSSGATTGGNVVSDGGALVIARGVAYGTAVNPTISGLSTSDGSGTGAFTSVLTGLSPATNYYVRAYATNSVGTAYGSELSFSTLFQLLPTVELGSVVGCIGDTLVVPVNMLNANSIGAITLGLTYNAGSFEYLGASNLHPSIASSAIINAPAPGGSILLSWYDLVPASINGILFNMKFRALSSGVSSSLTWDLSFNELADSTATPVSGVTYTNGSISVGAAPSVSIGSATGCVGNVVGIPVSLNSACGVGAISLTIPFDAARLSFSGFSGVSSLINDSNLTVNSSQSSVAISWFGYPSVLPAGNLLTLNFNLLTGGTSSLVVQTSSSEIANGLGVAYSGVVYQSGSVTAQGVTIGSISGNLNVYVGGSTTLSASVQGAHSQQWQVSADGGQTWSNVTNVGAYTGATTNQLRISGVLASFANYQYRLQAIGNGGCQSTSSAVTLSVLIPNLAVSSAQGCAGDTVQVMVSIANAPNLGAISLALNYDAQAVQFIGFNNVNSQISSNVIINAPAPGGTVILSWYNLIPANINGSLVNFRFRMLSATGSSLVWDQSIVELADIEAVVVGAVTYSNGAVTSRPAPTFIGSGISGNTSIVVGGSTTLSAQTTAPASTYQWQVNTGGGWTNLSNNATYSGVSTSSLTISNIPTSFTGYAYRYTASVTGGCSSTSGTATLSVIVPPPALSFVPSTGCIGDTITVGVNLAYGFNLGAITLGLNYNASQFEYVGSSNVATSVAANFLVNSPAPGGSVLVSWYDVNSANINGLLFNMRFRVLVAGASSPLTWDVAFNELADSSAAVISGVTYTNSTVSSQSTPATTLNSVVCSPSTVTVGTQTFASSGTYTVTLPNAGGCDSVVTLNLIVNQPTAHIINQAICAPAVFTVGSQSFGASGTYTITLTNAVGCDSVVTLNLTVNPPLSLAFSLNGTTMGSVATGGSQLLCYNDDILIRLSGVGQGLAPVSGAVRVWMGAIGLSLNRTIQASGLQVGDTLYYAVAGTVPVGEYTVEVLNATDANGCSIDTAGSVYQFNYVVNEPEVAVGSATGCVGSSVSVPVTLNSSCPVGAISLALPYNASVLNFTGYSGASAAVNDSNLTVNASNGAILISWFGYPAVLPSGNLLNLNFEVLNSGTAAISVNAAGSEIANGMGVAYANVSYASGSVVATGPVAGPVTGNTQVYVGGTTRLTSVLQGAVSQQWQVSVDAGTNWSNVSNGGNYSGATTNQLTISSIVATLDDYRYRLVVIGAGGCQTTSSFVVLNVLIPNVGITSGSGCLGDTIQVSVSITDAPNLGAISMALNYNASAVQFIGFNNVNSQIASNVIINAPAPGGVVYLSWYNLIPASINGSLVNFRFRMLTGAGSDLTWDQSVVELADIEGNVVGALNYGNGAVVGLPTPSFTGNGVYGNTSVGVGGTVRLAALVSSTSNLQWQISTGTNTWSNLTNDATYSGVNSNELVISNVANSLNGATYRVLANETGGCSLASGTATITVLSEPLSVGLSAGSALNCQGGSVSIPVNISNAFAVTSGSIKLLYNSAALTYTGHSGVLSALSSSGLTISVSGDTLSINWSSALPLNLNGVLAQLQFTVNSAGGSSLSWYAAGSQINGPLGAALTGVSYGNGNVGVQVVSFGNVAGNTALYIGQSTSLSTSASGFASLRWQSSTNGTTWTDLNFSSTYGGVITQTLTISNASLSLNNTQYRLSAVSPLGCVYYSASVTLTVSLAPGGPQVFAGSVTGCLGDTISVPVGIMNGPDIAAVSLVMNYNNQLFRFVGVNQAIPQFGSTFIVNEPAPGGTVYFAWYNVNPILANGTLFNARFVALSTGSSALSWNTSQSELASSSGDVILNTTYSNGSVSAELASAFTGGVTGNLAVPLFGSTTLAATVTGATVLQWQVSMNGSVWTNVVDGAHYSGSNTAQLSISNVQLSMHGLTYRLSAQSALGCERFSTTATLGVILPSPSLSLTNTIGCTTDTLTIPVTLLNGYNLGAITLGLSYNASQFEYLGATDFATSVASSMLINSPAPGGSVLVSWYDVNAVNINGLLFNMRFRPLSAGVSSPVTWDLSFNELADSGANVVTGVSYTNGSLSVQPAPSVSVGNAAGCVGSMVSVPIVINNSCPTGAISLTLPYNASILNFTGYSSALGVINDSNLTVNASNGNVLISWFGYPAVSANGNLLTLNFNVVAAGNAAISVNAAASEISNGMGVAYSGVSYSNGAVTATGPVAGPVTGNTQVYVSGVTRLTSVLTDAVSQQWQVSADGGTNWTNVSNGSNYSGATTNQLTISAITIGFDDYRYRIVVTGTGGCQTISSSVTLNVLIPNVGISSAAACPEDTVQVSVSITDAPNLGAISMALNYDASAIQFVGFNNVNSQIASNVIINAPAPGGVVYVSWYNLIPASINGNLMNFRFRVLSNSGSALTWDQSIVELADILGNVVGALTYSNGAVTSLPVPSFVGNGVFGNTSVGVGGSVQLFALVAGSPGLQWQVNTGSGQWANLANDATYSGVTTNQLTISSASSSLNGYSYRVVASVAGGCSANSGSVTLSILSEPLTIVAGLGNVLGCQASSVSVPVNLSNAFAVSAASLKVLYNPTQITYTGFGSVSSALSGSGVNVTAFGDTLTISWSSSQPINLNGTLLNLQFNVLTSTGGSLSWNSSGSQLTNPVGGAIAGVTYQAGGISVQQVSVGAVSGNNNLFLGQSTSFNVSVSGFSSLRWQVSSDGVNWTNVNASSVYSGVLTMTLGINANSLALNGMSYRIAATSSLGCVYYSSSITLNVSLAPGGPIVFAGSLSGCVGDTISVPIGINNAPNVAAISLIMNYNSSLFDFIGVSQAIPQFGSTFIANEPAPGGRVYFAWYDVNPIASYGNLFHAKFVALGSGTSALTWDSVQSELASSSGDVILNTTYSNGSLSALIVPTFSGAISGNLNVALNSSTILTVSVNNASSLQWQVSSNGLVWNNVVDNATYSGSNTSSLSISGVQVSMQGLRYRVLASSGISCSRASASVTLTVVLPSPIVSVGSANGCTGDTLTIPVTLQHGYGLGAITLGLGYNAAQIEYLGVSEVSSAIAMSAIINAPQPGGNLLLSWYDLNPVNINGLLFNARFLVIGAATSPLTWNLNFNELADSTANVISGVVYNNGSVTTGVRPIVAPVSGSTSVVIGNATSFSVPMVAGVAYRWQVNSGSGWVDLSDGGAYSGSATNTLNIQSAVSLNGNQYRVFANGGNGCAEYSVSVTLQVVVPNPTLTVGTASACVGSSVSLPVSITYGLGLGAISLSMPYDASKLTYTGYTGAHPSINDSNLTVNAANGVVYFSWFGYPAIDLLSGTLVQLGFTVNSSGVATVGFNTAASELGNSVGNPISGVNYISGSITGSGPVVGAVSGNTNVYVGGTTILSTSVQGGVSLQWQVSTNGGASYSNVSNGSGYSGATTNQLSILGITAGMNGYSYRLKVVGAGGCETISAARTLAILIPNLGITSAVGCTGDTLIVSASITNAPNLGAISLALNYDPQVLQFIGRINTNSQISSNLITNAPAPGGTLFFSWYNLTPANLNGQMVDLRFRKIGAGNSNLVWDDQIVELADIEGNVVGALTYTNGIVTGLPSSAASLSATICAPAGYSFFGQTYYSSGTYTKVLDNYLGCDSVITLNLTVNQPSASSVSAEICAPSSYSFNGQSYSASGVYTATLTNAVGCDSVVTLNLLVKQPSATTLNSVVCSPSTVMVGTQTFASSGTYTVTLTNAVGCDSVVTLNLIVNQPTTHTINQAICAPAVFTVGSQNFGSTGTYTVTLTNAAGCDSVVTLNLLVKQPSATTLYDTLCSGSSVIVGSQSFGGTGIYTVTLTNAVGCDSVVTLHLIVMPAPAVFVSQPVMAYVGVGDVAGFSAVVSNALWYKWQVRSGAGIWSNINNNSTYSGAHSASLHVNTIASMNNLQYRVQVRGCQGVIVSAAAALVLYPQVAPIQVSIPNVTVCPAQNVVVPVLVSNFSNVGRLSMSFLYNSSALQLVNFVFNSGFSQASILTSGDTIRVIRNLTSGVSLTSDTLVRLTFQALGSGSQPIIWLQSPLASIGMATASPVGLVHRLQYQNGSVTIGGTSPTITSQPASATILDGGSVSFVVAASNAVSYQWQVRQGNVWVNLSNQAPYSGVTSSVLNISPVTSSLNNFRYRALVSGVCPPSVTSNQVTLGVNPNVPPIGLSLGSSFICTPGNVSIPVSAVNFNDVAALGLAVQYNASAMTFTGVSNVNSSVAGLTAVVLSANRISVNWASATSSQLGSGVLFRLNFSVHSSGALSWDSTSVNLAGLISTFGQPLPLYYGNGGVQVAQNTVSIASVSSLCANSAPVVLQGSPAGGTFSGSGVLGGVFNPSLVGPGTYLVSYTATDASSCTFTSSTFITVLALPIGNAGADQTICQGSSTTLTASSGSGFSYLWSTGETMQSISVSPNASSTAYWVRISNSAGCSITDTVVVNTYPSAVVSAGSDATICAGSSTTLSASGAVQYLWSPTTGLSSIVVAGPIANPSVTTSYVVTGISATGCITRDTVVVTVNPRPSIQVADTVVTYCGSGAGALLEASGAVSYVWSPSTGLSNVNIANPTATPAVTTLYTVTGTDANGCTNTATVRVFVPRVNAGANRIICAGSSTTLSTTYTGNSTGLLYQWTPATGLSSAFVASPVASPTQSTLYTVTVTDQTGCAVSSTVTVIVNPSPTVDAGLNVAIAPGQSIQLAGSVSGGASPVVIVWSPSTGLSATNIVNPIATPSVTTMYYLTATGSNGCSRNDSVLVTVDPNLSGSNISGRLVYRNVARTGISQGVMSLDTSSVAQSSVSVGSNGAYLFQFLPDRTYSLRATVNRTAGGITSADAQLINNYLANPNLMNGIAIQAADVDGNGVVNSADALLVIQRSVNMPNAVFNQFSPGRGNWITEQPLVSVQGANVVRDVEALSLGDVNADFNLSGVRIPSGFRFETENSPVVVAESIRSLPIYVEQAVELGSFQLFLDVPSGMRVAEVILSSTGERGIFHQRGSELNVGWFAQNGSVRLNKGEVMLEIKLQSEFSAQDVQVGVRGISLAYDGDAQRHEMVRVSVPKYVSSVPTLQVQCYPNPFSTTTQIYYELPESGKVDVYVTDYTGKI
ncbi:MAG: hypothetical protein FJY18_01260, partial [Bacteroidetes bacterium]|nr:hypothetical protein [Bacteroidota bacterium]